MFIKICIILLIMSNSCDLWINKYHPNNINNIIGNKMTLQKLNNWIENFDKHNDNSIIISGGHGIGKTSTIQLLLEKYNYKYKIIYPDEIKLFRIDMDFEDYYNFNNSIDMTVKMKSKSYNKLALVFDEMESITLSSEKKYILNIYKINAKNKNFPLIFITNTNHSKLVNDLKKNCNEYKFISPSLHELTIYIKQICTAEKIEILDDISINKLIEFTQYDIRRLLNVLQEYHYNFKTLNINNISEFIESSVTKDIDIGLYEASLNLINNNYTFEQIYKLYETDKVLIPLMLCENYYKKILSPKNKSSWNEQLDQIKEISNSLSIGDNIETSIYTDQNWYLQNIHGFYTCYNCSYYANKSAKKLSKTDMKFSADLNKTSLKNINKKNITNLEKIIGNKTIEEILILCKITNQLINNKKTDEIINILKTYKKDINIKDIELCLKINKTIDFIILSSKEKKDITNRVSVILSNI